MKKNRIIVIADEGEVLWESLVLPEQQRDLSGKKYSGCPFSFDSVLVSFDFNCSKARTGNHMPTCRTIRKMVITPYKCFYYQINIEMQNKIV